MKKIDKKMLDAIFNFKNCSLAKGQIQILSSIEEEQTEVYLYNKKAVVIKWPQKYMVFYDIQLLNNYKKYSKFYTCVSSRFDSILEGFGLPPARNYNCSFYVGFEKRLNHAVNAN